MTPPTGFAGYECIGDGDQHYGNNERCTISVVADSMVSAPVYQIENNWDMLIINNPSGWSTAYPSSTSP